MADLLGRRRVFMAGLILVAVASLAAGFAATEGQLIAARAAQGLGAAIISPVGPLDRHHALHRRRRAQQGARRLGRGRRLRRRGGRPARRHPHRRPRLGVGAVGQRPRRPVRAGADAAADRREPLGVGRPATSTRPARSPSPPRSRCWSTRWSTRPTPAGARPRRSACSALSAALFASFIAIELRSKAPLVPFSIFRIRTLTGANVVGLLVGASLFSMFFFISLYMQQVLGYSAIEAGLSYLPLALTIIVSAGVGSQLVTRLGFKPVLAAGMVFIAAGLVWFSQVSRRRRLPHRRPRSLAAGGDRPRLRLRAPPRSRRCPASQERESGLASGLINTSQQIGGALGLAVLATIANSRTDDVIAAAGGDPSRRAGPHRGLPGRLPRRRRVRAARVGPHPGPDPARTAAPTSSSARRARRRSPPSERQREPAQAGRLPASLHRVNIDWVIPARHAEIHDNLATIVGGGIDRQAAPEFPSVVGMMLAVRLTATSEEIGPDHMHSCEPRRRTRPANRSPRAEASLRSAPRTRRPTWLKVPDLRGDPVPGRRARHLHDRVDRRRQELGPAHPRGARAAGGSQRGGGRGGAGLALLRLLLFLLLRVFPLRLRQSDRRRLRSTSAPGTVANTAPMNLSGTRAT